MLCISPRWFVFAALAVAGGLVWLVPNDADSACCYFTAKDKDILQPEGLEVAINLVLHANAKGYHRHQSDDPDQNAGRGEDITHRTALKVLKSRTE